MQACMALAQAEDSCDEASASARGCGPRSAAARRLTVALQIRRSASRAYDSALTLACNAAASHFYRRPVQMDALEEVEVMAWVQLILLAGNADPEPPTQVTSSPRSRDYQITLRLPPGAPIDSAMLGRIVRGRVLTVHPDSQSRRRQAANGRMPMLAAAADRRFRHVTSAAETAADPQLRAAADAELLAHTRLRVAAAAASASAASAADLRAPSPPTADWITADPVSKAITIGGVLMETGSAPSADNACVLDSLEQLTGFLSRADSTLLARRQGGLAHVRNRARSASELLLLSRADVLAAVVRSYIDSRAHSHAAAYIPFTSLDRDMRTAQLRYLGEELDSQLAGWSAAEFRGMTSSVGLAALSLDLGRTIVVVDISPRPGSARMCVDVYGQWLGNDLHLLFDKDHYVPLFRPSRGGGRGRRGAVPRWTVPAGPPADETAAAAADLAAATEAAAAAEEQLRRSAGQAARAALGRSVPPAGPAGGRAGGHANGGSDDSERRRQAHQRQHNANVRRDRNISCDVCHTRASVRGSAKGEIFKCSGPGAGQDGYCTGARHANCRHEDQAAHPAYSGQGPFFCSVACRMAREADPRDDDDDDSSSDGMAAAGQRPNARGSGTGLTSRRPRPPRVAHNDRQNITEELLAALREVDVPSIIRRGQPPMLKDVPSGSRRQLSALWAEACSLTADADPGDDGPDPAPFILLDLFAYLLLVRPSHDETASKRCHTIVNRRFKRLTVQHDVAGLLQYADDRRREEIDLKIKNAGDLQNLSVDEAAAKAALANTNRADHHASEGYISRALRVLAHEVPPPVDIALQKLTQLSRPAGAPISDAFLQFAPPRLAFTEAESPRDEQELMDLLLDVVASSKSAAGGPNGLTGRLLRGMLLDSEDALRGTLLVLDKYANGQVPARVAESMRMSHLVALRKPSPVAPAADAVPLESPPPPPAVGIRPIAMGQLMRRMAGKMLLRLHHDKYCRSVGVAQLGLEKCAAEVGYHAATLKLQSTMGSKCILMWDIEHAFGSAERAHGLDEMTRCVPEAVPFVRHVYSGQPGELLYTEPVTGKVHSFASQQGFDQGCPQAGPLFCFAYKPALDEVSLAYPDVLVSAYYDDSPMAGSTLQVAEAYKHMIREGGPLRLANMRNHPEKTYVWSPTPLTDEERAAFPAGTRFEPPDSGIIMWGCPIGSDAFIRRTLDAAVLERFEPAVDGGSLDELHAQNSMICMRMGINARFDNLLRVVSPRILAEAATTWDDNVLSYVERFVGSSLPRDAQTKVALPLRDGGLGLRSKTQLMHVAFLSAWLASRSLIWKRFPSLRAALRDTSAAAATPLQAMEDVDATRSSASPGGLASDLRAAYNNVITNAKNCSLLAELLGARGLGGFTAPDACPEVFNSLQKKLSTNVHSAAKDALLQRTDRRGQALIRSAGGTGASAWLTAQRAWGDDFVMPNQHMRAAIAFRLGIDLPQLADAGLISGLCPLLQCSKVNAEGLRVYLDPSERYEACTGICDAKGDHLLGCKFGHHGRIGRHNGIVNVIARMVRTSFAHKVHVITDQTLLKHHMQRFDQPGAPPSKHHVPDWRVIWHTLGHDDDIGDAVVTGFNQVATSGFVTGASALKIQQNKYKQYTSAVLSRPAPVTTSQLIAFAMDSAGYIAPDGNAMLKKLGERKAAITCDGVADSSLSRKSQSQRAAIYRQHMTQAISVTLMRSQMHVILQAAYNGHQRNATPCARVPMWARPQFFDASWAAAYNATSFC